jgi:putative flippase GtrA
MKRFFKNGLPREIVLYGLIGGLSAGVDTLLFWLLSKDISPFFANCISVTMGITISFLLNTFVNFKVRDRLFIRALSFYLIGFAGLALSSLLLYLGIEVLQMGNLLVKIISVFIVAAVQFTLNKLLTFRKQNKGEQHEQSVYHHTGL